MMAMEKDKILAEKKSLRKRMRKLRSEIPAQERQIISSRITAELSRQYFFQDANVVMAYASMLEEVQLYDLMKFSLDIGKKVCIPFIKGNGIMDAVELLSMGDLVEDDYSILTVCGAQTYGGPFLHPLHHCSRYRIFPKWGAPGTWRGIL